MNPPIPYLLAFFTSIANLKSKEFLESHEKMVHKYFPDISIDPNAVYIYIIKILRCYICALYFPKISYLVIYFYFLNFLIILALSQIDGLQP